MRVYFGLRSFSYILGVNPWKQRRNWKQSETDFEANLQATRIFVIQASDRVLNCYLATPKLSETRYHSLTFIRSEILFDWAFCKNSLTWIVGRMKDLQWNSWSTSHQSVNSLFLFGLHLHFHRSRKLSTHPNLWINSLLIWDCIPAKQDPTTGNVEYFMLQSKPIFRLELWSQDFFLIQVQSKNPEHYNVNASGYLQVSKSYYFSTGACLPHCSWVARMDPQTHLGLYRNKIRNLVRVGKHHTNLCLGFF